MENKKYLIYVIPVVAVLFTLSIGIADAMHLSPEEAERKEAKAHHNLRIESCAAIAEKITECFTGDKEQCDALQDSTAWFSNKFNEYPELACPNANDPLVFGAETK